MAHRTRVDCRYLVAYRDSEHRVIDRGVLVYEGDRVVFVGESYDEACDETIDATDKIVAPGFVSAHTHMSGSPFDKSFQDDVTNPYMWGTGLYEILMPIRSATTCESARAALRASCLELMRSGVTTAVELTGWAEEAAQVAEEAGLRTYVGPYFRSSTWSTDGYSVSYDQLTRAEETRLVDEAVSFVQSWSGGADRLVRGLLAPAQVDTCSPELLRRAAELARSLDVPIQIHAGQSVLEFREIMRRSGRTPVEYLANVGLLAENLIVGHCLFVSGHSWLDHSAGDDIGLLASSGTTVAHCPRVFARKGQGMESLGRYRREGVRVALGLDTSPQSMLLEMRLAGTLGKVLGHDGRAVTAKDLFDAATIDGADALGREDLGRLAPGSKADFVVFRTKTPSMAPLRDPVRNIVYSALSSDVESVVIDGKPVLSGGSMRTMDETEVLDELQAAADGVWTRLGDFHHARRSVDEISVPSLRRWA